MVLSSGLDLMEAFSPFVLELQESPPSEALVPAVGALNFANGSWLWSCCCHSDRFRGIDGSLFVRCEGLGLFWFGVDG